MAASGKAGKLTVDIEANVAKLQKDMAKARGQLKGLEKTAKKTSSRLDRIGRAAKGVAKLGVAAAGAGAAFIVARKAVTGFMNAIDRADLIAKTADRIGITTDALQELRFAADRTGVSSENLDKALEGFVKRVGEAKAGTGTLITLLNKMGGTLLTDLKAAENTSEAFDLMVDAISKFENQADRAALSAAAFGRSAGVGLTNLLKGGSVAIQEYKDRANELGIVIDERLLRSSEQTKDAMTDLSTSIKANLTTAFISLGPVIEDVVDLLTGAAIEVGKFFKAIERREAFKEAFEDLQRIADASPNVDVTASSILNLNVAFSKLGDTLKSTIAFSKEQQDELIKFAASLKQAEEVAKKAEQTGTGGISKEQQESLKEALDIRLQTWLDFFDKRRELESRFEQESIAIVQASEQTKVQLKQMAISNVVALLNVFAGKSKALAIVAIAIEKAAAIASVSINGIRAAAAARAAYAELAALTGNPALIAVGEAEAARIKGLTALNIGLIGATGLGQAVNVASGGGGGGAVSAGTGATSPAGANQIPQFDTARGGGGTTIIFQGGTFIGGDKNQVARDLIPGIEQALMDGTR